MKLHGESKSQGFLCKVFSTMGWDRKMSSLHFIDHKYQFEIRKKPEEDVVYLNP